MTCHQKVSKSNKTVATIGAGNATPTGPPEFNPGF